MNRSEMRDFFRATTGRTVSSDEKINQILNAATKFLAPKITGYLSDGLLFAGLGIGENMLNLSRYLQSVSKVYYKNSDGAYIPMTLYKDVAEFIEDFPTPNTSGTPLACVVMPNAVLQSMADIATHLDAGEQWTTTDLSQGDGLFLMFSMMAEEQVHLRLLGKRAITSLENDTDSNLFTLQHPYLLCQAGLFIMETEMKHFKQANDIMASIDNQIFSIAKASIRQDAESLGDQVNG